MGRFAVIKKRECWKATWFGQLLKLIILLSFILIYAFRTVGFLSPNAPVTSNTLIVEGFLPDYALVEAMHIFEQGGYQRMIITGKKRPKGAPLDQYANDGEYSAATLARLGYSMDRVQVVAEPYDITKDRTYESALAIQEWAKENNLSFKTINLVSLGCHSRRSRLMFEKAFGDSTEVGIIAIRNQGFNPKRWWSSSIGFREVNKESLAWIYARFFFYP